MKLFVRSVVTGFALSLGAALFKKVAKKLGLDDDAQKKEPEVVRQDGATDPGLQSRFS